MGTEGAKWAQPMTFGVISAADHKTRIFKIPDLLCSAVTGPFFYSTVMFLCVCLFVCLPGDGDQRDFPAQNGQGCGGRGHSRHQGAGGHNRVHQAGTLGEAHVNT